MLQSTERHEPTEAPSGARARLDAGLITDLCFFWDTPHPELEVRLITLNGTIVGRSPLRVSKGERLPIHRKFVPLRGAMTWYLRVAADGPELSGLAITVELRDRVGQTRTLPVAFDRAVLPSRVLAVEQTFEVPEELLL